MSEERLVDYCMKAIHLMVKRSPDDKDNIIFYGTQLIAVLTNLIYEEE